LSPQSEYQKYMKIFFRLLRFSRPYHHYMPEYIIFIFLYIIFGLANFTLLAPLFDILFDTGKISQVHHLPSFSLSTTWFKDAFSYYVTSYAQRPSGKQGVLIFVSLVTLACVVLKNVFAYLAQKAMTRMRVNMVRKIRHDLYDQYAFQSLGFYVHQRKGDLISTMSNDVVEIENSLVASVTTIFRDPLQIISTFFVLFYLSPQMTLFTLIFFPISGGLISMISRKLKKGGGRSQAILGKILNVTEETLSGIRIIKAFNAENFMRKRFDRENTDFANSTKAVLNQRELASPLAEVLGVAVIVVIVMYGGTLILRGNTSFTASSFIAYIALYYQIIAPAKSIASAVTALQRGLAAGERVLSVIDVPNNIVDAPGAKSISSFSSNLEYKNVSFRYDQAEVLKEVNLIIPKGKIIALVGSSGAGKSTLADLLPRFYDVTGGGIFIDGQDIRSLKTHSLRELIGIVSQEPILFNDSVFNNIAFGVPDAKMEDVIAAAKVANAHEFISQMEEGYHSTIGDKGMKLSGGQRQRLTIARAVFKNPSILILDEATSSLDTESEQLVQEAINNMMQHRTSIVIAHRLSTVRHADEIIVLQKGAIVERGTHDELVQHQGIYRRLLDMQEVK
jgi:subfamily B ATP-binding cassette protein MsbA